jgi:hypothetical protein
VHPFAGGDTYGALGNGSTTDSAVPVAVSGGGTWSAVSAGWQHTCGLKTGGTLFCWGGWVGVGDLSMSVEAECTGHRKGDVCEKREGHTSCICMVMCRQDAWQQDGGERSLQPSLYLLSNVCSKPPSSSRPY